MTCVPMRTGSHPAATLILVVGMALLSACGMSEDAATGHTTASVRLATVERRDFEVRALAYGIIEPASSAAHTLTVQVESEVAELVVRPGQYVLRGQRLALLRPSAATDVEFGRAQRDAFAAQVEWQRVARLREQSLATESELQSARTSAESAAALRDSLQLRVGASGTREWRSPRDGVVDALTARPGELLPPGSTLLRILPERSSLIRLGIEANLASSLSPGATLLVTSLDGETSVRGHVQSVDARIDPQSGLVTVLAKLDGTQEWPCGRHVRAQVILATHVNALGVPRSAVLYDGDKSHVFVVEHEVARRREVRVGVEDRDTVELLSGVKFNERVAIVGNDELAEGMAVRVDSAEPEATAR